MNFESAPNCSKCSGPILHLIAGEGPPAEFADKNSSYWSVWLKDGSRRHWRCRPGVQTELAL